MRWPHFTGAPGSPARIISGGIGVHVNAVASSGTIRGQAGSGPVFQATSAPVGPGR